MLQQYLPFTVLKHKEYKEINSRYEQEVATVPTVYGIETNYVLNVLVIYSCNSTYRLRYWNQLELPGAVFEILERCNSTYRLRYWNQQITI